MSHALRSSLFLGSSALGLVALLTTPFTTSCGPGDPAVRGPFFAEVGAAGGVAWSQLGRDGDTTLADRMDGGVCILDANGDDHPDFFLASRVAGHSVLYVTTGFSPLAWENRTAAAGLSLVGDAIGCLAFDAEGDGDDDLLLTGVGNLQFFVQQSPGRFVPRDDLMMARVPTGHILVSSAAGDMDQDGDLDVVIAGYVDASSFEGGDCGSIPCAVIVDRFTPARSYYLENQSGVFIDRTALVMPDLMEAEPTLVFGIADLDANGSQDVLVGNDVGALYQDLLLIRAGTVFTDMAMARALATDAVGHGVDSMGIAFGDLNGDQRLDVTQTTYAELVTPVWICEEDGLCIDRGRQEGTLPSADNLRWSNALIDVDLDGDLDLFEVAGHVFLPTEGRSFGVNFAHAAPPVLFLRGETGFRRTASNDALARPIAGRGMGVADFDDDGRLDLVIGVTSGTPFVLRNQTTSGHYLRVVLNGLGANPRGIGARVEVTDALGTTRARVVRAGEGYASTYDPRVHVGLPDAGAVSVTVRWPSGAVTTVADVAVDAELAVTETPL